VQIFAAKVVFDSMETFHLQEVGIQGKTKVDVKDGIAEFSKLKFNSTSYNHEVKKLK